MPHCTLIIPVPRAEPTEPGVHSAPRIALRLHTQHLSAKSALLSGLLSGASPLDLVRDLAASRLRPASVPIRIPRSQLPRLLPSPPSHPVLFLPVPDPSSIQPLFCWMYSNNTDHIQHALDRGLIHWEGLARNVEYLCLSTDIKVFLGRWYRSWLLPSHRTPCPADDGDQSDLDSECPSSEDEDGCHRGRTRDIKPLVQLCEQLHT